MDKSLVEAIKSDSLSQEEFESLARKKIYFGHQSVGYNIIDGMTDILKENPNVNLNIVETKDPAVFSRPILAHSCVGRNTDPISKLEDFKKAVDGGLGEKVDAAFLKFCYIDISGDTNVGQVFDFYKDTFDYLKSTYPNVKFIHCTIPLVSSPEGIKSKLKRVIGLSLWTDSENVKRNEFNDLLIRNYPGSVFDLAKFEATKLDGSIESFKKGGKEYYSLVAAYTDDGGHLNKLGRKWIANQLLRFLALK